MRKYIIRALILAIAIVVAVIFIGYIDSPTATQDHNLLSCNTSGVVEQFKSEEDKHQCSNVLVDAQSLIVGNPRRDGIPAIDNPKFVSADSTPFSDDELIIGVSINGDTRAYPYSILNWHEIVNDNVGGVPLSVTYCPLCETNTVFIREVNGKETTFGTSGALYQSCLVMYDRLTKSLWVQPWGLGIMGDGYGHHLERVEGVRTTLGAWRRLYPETKVLSTNTGYTRDYGRYPYGPYYTNEDLLFPIRNLESLSTHPKEISFVALSAGEKNVFDEFGGEIVSVTLNEMRDKKEAVKILNKERVIFTYNENLDTVQALSESGESVPLMAVFGFVLPAFFGK